MTKKIQKCYIYTRVSTAIQVDGYSLEAQKDKLRKYAEFQDYTIAGEYSDEGFSGKNIQGRLDFQRMLQDIQDRKDDVDYVLVFKLSRFGRNAADVLNSLQLMQDFGVNLICVEDGIDSSKDAGKLMISVLSAVAEIERENILRSIWGRSHTAEDGQKRRSAPGMRCMWLNSPSSRCMMGNTKPSFLKKTGTWHRKNGKRMPIAGRRSMTSIMSIFFQGF